MKRDAMKRDTTVPGTAPGFTLTETLVTMAIIAIIVTPIFVTFNNAINSVQQKSVAIERALLANNFYEDAHRTFVHNNETRQELSEKRIHTTFTYSATKLPDTSKVASISPTLYLEKITIGWQDRGTQKEDVLTTFCYKPA
jgi:prepilin-type N-terminal cleavage/methylation domain-containing protein